MTVRSVVLTTKLSAGEFEPVENEIALSEMVTVSSFGPCSPEREESRFRFGGVGKGNLRWICVRDEKELEGRRNASGSLIAPQEETKARSDSPMPSVYRVRPNTR